jgi:hypothetical protein
MTAAELGLLLPPTPKVCLPEPQNSSRATASTLSDAPIVTQWFPKPSMPARISRNSYLPLHATVDDEFASSFVAAKLPYFHDIDPFDLTTPSDLALQTTRDEYLKSQPRSTSCNLNSEDDYDVEERSLRFSQSLRGCEEGRMPGLVHAVSATTQAYALGVDWTDEPVVDWPYDALGSWDDEPFLDWNGEPVVDWDDKPIDDCLDDVIVIDHDAETYDWTFLSQGGASSDYASTLSSRFSSMEVLPLPLRDSFMEETSIYEEPVRELAEHESNMRRVSKSAWDSESDFCIPVFF